MNSTQINPVSSPTHPQPTRTIMLTDTPAPIMEETQIIPSATLISPTPKPSPTQMMIPKPLPELLVNIGGVADFLECSPDGSSEIWVTKYPYTLAQKLLSDTQKNYYAPTWSPNGEWIAFIESKASYLYENGTSSSPDGGDVIGVIHPDGTEKHGLSEAFSRLDYIYIDGCQKLDFINPFLSWSPDNRYLAFSHLKSAGTDFQVDYYLVDVENGITKFLLNQSKNSSLVWSSDSTQLLLVGKELVVFQLNHFDDLLYETIPIPPDSGSLEDVVWPINQALPIVIIYHYTSPDTYRSLWTVNLLTDEWIKLMDLKMLGEDKGSGDRPRFGQFWAVSAGVKSTLPIYIIDQSTWSVVNGVVKHSNNFDLSGFPRWFADSFGEDVFSYLSYGREIWGVKPGFDNFDVQLLMDIETLGFSNEQYLIDFAWKP